MKSFKEFNIKPALKNFTGDKIKMERILNREITVHDFKVEKSKFDKGHGQCLYLQIELNGNMYVVFSGSSVLIQTIQQVPKEGFPFTTTVVKENEHFEFK